MTTRYTHKQRILNLLEVAGEQGIHSFDMVRLVTHKCATRISELKRDGYNINCSREKRGSAYGVRYKLTDTR